MVFENIYLLRIKEVLTGKGGENLILVDLRGMRKKVFAVLAVTVLAACIYIFFMTIGIQTSTAPDKTQYKDYTGYEGRFKYRLPADWSTAEQKFEGREILYHNDFISGDKKILGYVQVWNLNIPLKDFIEEARENAVKEVTFKEYSMEPVRINNKEGYILQYTRDADNGKYMKAFEVFIIDEGNTFHRFAFYMDEKSWKDNMRMLFLNIAATGVLK